MRDHVIGWVFTEAVFTLLFFCLLACTFSLFQGIPVLKDYTVFEM